MDNPETTPWPAMDLYPLPGHPSNPPTWEDIERLSMHYPAARDAVTMVQRGDWTREQALIALAFSLAESFSRMFRLAVDRRNCEPPKPFLITPDGKMWVER